MWWVTMYLVRYYPANTPSVIEWHNGEVVRDKFVWYLIFIKHYREDVRDTLGRWGASLLKEDTFRGELGRARKQRRSIDDTLDGCIKRGYIKKRETALHPTTSEVYLSASPEGRDFVYNPFRFVDECLKEYGYIVSLIGGGIIVEILNFILHT